MALPKNKKIRTRFAPSPTGYLHVGGLRTALYSYLFARQNGGDFLLRVEDTDQTREVEGAVENMLKSLKWAGLSPDEGVLLSEDGKPSEKGKFGPYTQSARVKLYQKYAQELVSLGKAYFCFCGAERLEQLRANQQAANQPTHYDKECLKLSADEVKAKLDNNEKYVIRMKVDGGQLVEFDDVVRGQIKFNTNDIDDQIILKSDGFPTYHLASVVDDHLMAINYVIRGDEWLPSTPKHVLLYQAFGWDIPEFAHLPLILNPDKTKLSKRQGDVAVEDYRDKGYLSEAIVNFVALLGWNPGTEQEVFSLKELIKVFDLKKVHKAGAVFNQDKLDWLNGEYIKKMDLAEFIEMSRPYLEKNIKNLPAMSDGLKKVFAVEKERISRLDEIGQELVYLFDDKFDYDATKLVWKKSTPKATKENLQSLLAFLDTVKTGDWHAEKLEKIVREFIASAGLQNGDVLWPMRFALTGQEKSPTPFEVAEILGQEKSLARLKMAIEKMQ